MKQKGSFSSLTGSRGWNRESGKKGGAIRRKAGRMKNDKIRSCKWTAALCAVLLFAGTTALGGVIGVDWGGHYGAASNFTSTLNQGLGSAVTPTGDYTFDSNSDTAYRIPFGTAYSPSADSRYLAPSGKTGPLYTGMMLVNHSSATAPNNAGIYRWYATTTPNQLTKTNPTLTGDYTTMSMSTAYFAKKADFLNGLDSAGSVGFADQASGASVSLAVLRNKNAGVATIGFIAQEGSDWYVSVAWTRPTNANDWAGTLTINPYEADWYAFDPAANQLLNTGNLGTAKAGSTFTDVNAFGIIGQSFGYTGTVANSQKLDFDGFSVALIPEPATIGMLGLGALATLLFRRLRLKE